jgi:hypothetical protein
MKLVIRVAIAFCCSSLVAFAQHPMLSKVPAGIATQPGQSRGTPGSGGVQTSAGGLQFSSGGIQSMAALGEPAFGRTTGSFGVSLLKPMPTIMAIRLVPCHERTCAHLA